MPPSKKSKDHATGSTTSEECLRLRKLAVDQRVRQPAHCTVIVSVQILEHLARVAVLKRQVCTDTRKLCSAEEALPRSKELGMMMLCRCMPLPIWALMQILLHAPAAFTSSDGKDILKKSSTRKGRCGAVLHALWTLPCTRRHLPGRC